MRNGYNEVIKILITLHGYLILEILGFVLELTCFSDILI